MNVDCMIKIVILFYFSFGYTRGQYQTFLDILSRNPAIHVATILQLFCSYLIVEKGLIKPEFYTSKTASSLILMS